MIRRNRLRSKIAEERIELLYGFAGKVFKDDPILANRYVAIAKRIGMRCQVRIPQELRRFTCRKCGSLLVPGVNCRVRTRPRKGAIVVVTCLNCGDIKRYPTFKERHLRHSPKV